MPDEAPLLVTREGGLARIRMNRPHKLNSLSLDLCAALGAALAELESDAETRVVLLSGEGASFSAGADLAPDGQIPIDTDWPVRRHDHRAWQRVLEAFDRLPQVTVAKLHGHVIGGATLLAAACDIRFADHDVSFRIPEVAMGIPLTWNGIPLLIREVGMPRARDWILSGRMIAPTELATAGFVQHLVSPAELDSSVESYLEGLLSQPAAPLAMTRAMMSALDRAHPAMVAGWADADLLQWSLRESGGWPS